MLSHWLLRVSPIDPGAPQYGGVPPEVFSHLQQLYPHLVARAGALEIKGGSDEAEFDDWLQKLTSAGVRVPADKSETPSQVVIYKYQDWSDAAVAAAALLEPGSLAPEIAEGHRPSDNFAPEWIVRVEPRLKKQRSREFGCFYAYPNLMLVRGEVKSRLESAGLKHLFLKPLQIEGGDWPKEIEPLYLIWSDLELPPITNMLFDNKGRVFPSKGNRGPFTHGCLPVDGLYTNAQLRYHSADIAAVGEFDIGYTYERFGNREPCWRTPIISQRFKAVCEEMKLPIKWVPVAMAD